MRLAWQSLEDIGLLHVCVCGVCAPSEVRSRAACFRVQVLVMRSPLHGTITTSVSRPFCDLGFLASQWFGAQHSHEECDTASHHHAPACDSQGLASTHQVSDAVCSFPSAQEARHQPERREVPGLDSWLRGFPLQDLVGCDPDLAAGNGGLSLGFLDSRQASSSQD